jgi:hypothetical protein
VHYFNDAIADTMNLVLKEKRLSLKIGNDSKCFDGMQ